MRSLTVKLYRDKASANGKPCPYCRLEMDINASARSGRRPSRDHIRPKSHGRTLADNKLICCERCNQDKGSLTLWRWHGDLKIERDPRAPFVLEVIVALYPYLGHEAYAEAVGAPSDEVWIP